VKGNNEIHLNRATMVEAVQLWLGHTFKNPPEARRVEQHTDGHTDVFVLTVKEAEEPKP
jgi:hypothetical protein